MTAPSDRPGRLGVGVVGAGHVGAVLGNALRAAGHPVVAVSAVSEASLERAEMLLPGVPVVEVPEVVRRAELVLLAVPDDALAPLVAGLAATGAWQAGQLVVHTAGRYGTAILDPARAAGAIPLAIHPAMTFTGTSLDLHRLEGCPFAVTAPAAVLPIAQALVVEIGGEPVVVGEAERGLYHAGLAHGANHLTVLVAQASAALAAAGIDDPGRMLRPLLEAALDGALRSQSREGGPGAIGALTGPVRRGDAGTVAEHIDVLTALAATTGAVDVVAGYRTLARAATVRAVAAGMLDEAAAQRLLDVLAGPPGGTGPGSPGSGGPDSPRPADPADSPGRARLDRPAPTGPDSPAPTGPDSSGSGGSDLPGLTGPDSSGSGETDSPRPTGPDSPERTGLDPLGPAGPEPSGPISPHSPGSTGPEEER